MNLLYGIGILGLFGFLVTHPSQGLAASRYGLSLWFDTLVPTLLPFLILSGFCIQSGLLEQLLGSFKKPPQKYAKLSPNGLFALTAGFLCGFPTGAKILGDLRRNGKIRTAEAQCLLNFCNNASPGFVLTYLIHEKLHLQEQLPAVLLLVYGIPLGYGLVSLAFLPPADVEVKKAPRTKITFGLLDACIYDACITILKLGGYIMLFSILAEMIACIPVLSAETCAFLTAILELTSGIDRIASAFPAAAAPLAAIPLTVFGGLCTLAQTISVLKGSGLRAGSYVRAKAVTSLLSFAGVLLWMFFAKA